MHRPGAGSTSNIYRALKATGGIAPIQRCRSSRVLSFGEREEISRGIAAGEAFRSIARRLDRAVSTVSQEVARHGGRGHYRAAPADSAAWESARRPKPCLLSCNRQLQRIVAARLKQDWSPQQIAGWLKGQYPGHPEMWVSHQTIYRSLFVQARGALKKTAWTSSLEAADPPAPSCHRRPHRRADYREGDLVEGSRGTFIATLVERQSRFVVLVKLPEKRTEVVVDALIKAVRKLPAALRRSLTWDRCSELTQHARFTVATDVKVFFCDPYCP